MDKFKIEYTGWHSHKEEIGLDYVYFDAMVYPTEKGLNSFPVFIPYDKIEKQIEEDISGGANILKQIKQRVRGWGPKQSLYVSELEQCGIDLKSIFMNYIENSYNLDDDALMWSKNEEIPDDLIELTTELESSLIDVKLETEQYFSICERLEKVISKAIVGLFPELLNSSSAHILEIENILKKHIPDIAEDINNLVIESTHSNEDIGQI